MRRSKSKRAIIAAAFSAEATLSTPCFVWDSFLKLAENRKQQITVMTSFAGTADFAAEKPYTEIRL